MSRTFRDGSSLRSRDSSSVFSSKSLYESHLEERESQLKADDYNWTSRFGHICLTICFILDSVTFCTELPHHLFSGPSDIAYCISVFLAVIPILYVQIFIGQYTQWCCLYYGQMLPMMHGLGASKLLLTVYDLVRTSFDTGFAGYYLIMILNESRKTCLPEWGSDCTTLQEVLACNGPECMGDIHNISSYKYFWNIYGYPNTIIIFITIILSALGGAFVAASRRYFLYMVEVSLILMTVTVSLMITGSITLTSVFPVQLSKPVAASNLKASSFKGLSDTLLHPLLTLKISEAGHTTYGTHLSLRVKTSLQTILIGLIFILCIGLGSMLYRMSFYSIIEGTHWKDGSDSNLTEKEMFYVIVQDFIQTNFEKGSFFPLLFNTSCLLLNFSKLMTHIDVICETLINYFTSFKSIKVYIIAAITLMDIVFLIPYFLLPKYVDSSMIIVYKVTSTIIIEIEIIGVLYVYSYTVLSDDIHFTFGTPPASIWKNLWLLVPVCHMIGTIIFFHKNNEFNTTVTVIVIFTLFPIIIGGIYKLYKCIRRKCPLAFFMPQEQWGMRSADFRKIRYMYNPRDETKFRRRRTRCMNHRCLLGSEILDLIVQEEVKAFAITEKQRKLYSKKNNKDDKKDDDASSDSSSEDQIVQLPRAKRSFYSDLAKRRGY